MKSNSARPTAMKMPSITPRTATPRKQAIDRANSILRMRYSLRTPAASISPIAAEMTTAASAESGRFRTRLGKNSSISAIARAPTSPVSQLRLGAGGFGDRGSRGAAADRESLEEAGGDIGRAERDQLLVRVDPVAASDREGPRKHAGVGEGDQGDPNRPGYEGREVVGRHAGDLQRREPPWGAVPPPRGHSAAPGRTRRPRPSPRPPRQAPPGSLAATA